MTATILRHVVLTALSVWSIPGGLWAVEYPGTDPGPAQVSAQAKELIAGNRILSARWAVSESGLKPGTYTDLQSGSTITLSGDLFQITTADGSRLSRFGTDSAGATGSHRASPSVRECLPRRNARQGGRSRYR